MSEYRERLECYILTMLQAKRMLESGIITATDYERVDEVIAEKYGISDNSIYHGIDLLYSGFRGNISATKEGEYTL